MVDPNRRLRSLLVLAVLIGGAIPAAAQASARKPNTIEKLGKAIPSG